LFVLVVEHNKEAKDDDEDQDHVDASCWCRWWWS
jgi:hypothetical protein